MCTNNIFSESFIIYRIAKFIKNTAANIGGWWNNKPAKKYTLNDIDQSDTDLAFMLWFGGLALVISIPNPIIYSV